jgi:hypothetical protein
LGLQRGGRGLLQKWIWIPEKKGDFNAISLGYAGLWTFSDPPTQSNDYVIFEWSLRVLI